MFVIVGLLSLRDTGSRQRTEASKWDVVVAAAAGVDAIDAGANVATNIIPATLVVFIGRGIRRATAAGGRWPGLATGGVAGRAALASGTVTLASGTAT